MGTPDFAVNPLKRLYSDGHDIACVVTQPDKPRGRGMKAAGNPVKKLAMENGAEAYQPVSLKNDEITGILSDMRCDLIAVVAYGKLLPRAILDIPPLGCINIHGSLLPKYRGAAPVQRAVLNGEKETGVTSMYLSEELDAGDILLSRKTIVGEDETAGELSDRLSILGAELLSDSIDAIARNTAVRIPQNHAAATFAPLLSRDLSPIDWTGSAYNVKCHVRGLNPWPMATVDLNGTVCKVFSVEIGDIKTLERPGTILSAGKDGIEIACGDGTVRITELQAPGGKRMAAADYLRGHSI